MVRRRARTVWSSLSDETRVGFASGLVLSVALAVTVALHRELALGMGVLPHAIHAGTATPKPDDLRRGVVLLYPGFFAGAGAGIWWHVRHGLPASARSSAKVLVALTAVPVVTTLLLGVLGFAAVVGALSLEGGIVSGVVLGLFFGGLVFGVALGGALVVLLGTLLSAGVGLCVSHGLAVLGDR